MYWTLVILVSLLALPIVLAMVGYVWAAVCLLILPKPLALRAIWWTLHLAYRIHLHDADRIPRTGGALLVANHISWLDGILMGVCAGRPVRMIVYAGNFQHWMLRVATRRWSTILMMPAPKSIVRALQAAKEGIEQGDLVGIFPEGGITRSGCLQAFRPGLLRIVEGTGAPIIPMFLDGLWGSVFSFQKQKFFWKMPRRWPYRIDIYFGQPLHSVADVHTVRQQVQQLGAHALSERLKRSMNLPESVVRACKQRLFTSKVADSAGSDMKGGELLMRALILRRLLRRHILQNDETHVGLLLPPSAGAAVTNLALTLDRRVAVNLNYTVSSQVMNQCIELAGIRHVLTSRKVMEKLDLQINVPLVYLEDLREKLSFADKLVSSVAAYAVPASWLSASLKLREIDPEDVMTVIFTSGSTGVPKGVMLTFANIRSNVDAVDQVIHLKPEDTIIGILPFFHSFGYTVTLWTVLALDIRGAYHFNPLDARQVGKLVQKNRGTILLSTPTFLRSYARRCTPEEFATLNTVVAGAEKLPKDLCDAFEERFHLRPVEGYGTTELSPLVSVNIPPSRSTKSHQVDLKEGTVGRPVPGVAAKVVDLDSGQELGTNVSGMLLIKGPNVMKGYMHQPEKTAEVMRDGWYVTGDVAEIDDDGFIRITGRESRFSKIGGEMVPHLRIEEMLQQFIGGASSADTDGDSNTGPQVAVTAVPDSKKGERLVVIHTRMPYAPQDLCARLMAEGLPNIFIPSPDSFMEVDALPFLGTGKLDLRRLKDLALERFGAAS